jgi:alkanesulfonate monooxygenase SsuD/methylene tetrahydromethanopterin reductase-like flavin-dependent oxidoreductase (luciferase family)
MDRRPDKMRLSAFLTQTGQHPGAWRHPNVPADGHVDIAHCVENARIAERGLFDMILLADNAGVCERDVITRGRSGRIVHFEPITLLSALAMVTMRIGLVATATTIFNEPYNVARKFGSLDHISNGRAGWNLVTSANPAEALNFGHDAHAPPTSCIVSITPDGRSSSATATASTPASILRRRWLGRQLDRV